MEIDGETDILTKYWKYTQRSMCVWGINYTVDVRLRRVMVEQINKSKRIF